MVRHFSTCVKGHLTSNRASYAFQHLQNSEHCRALCSADCFHVLDTASTAFQLKKGGNSFSERTTPLNQQLHHVNLKLSP